jgi:hypothetical protein
LKGKRRRNHDSCKEDIIPAFAWKNKENSPHKKKASQDSWNQLKY